MKKLLLIACLLWAAPAFSTTWYVSASGNELNDCTAAQSIGTPKRLIQSGLVCVGAAGTETGAGHTVQVAAGSYTETLTNVIPSGSGSGARFTLKCVTDFACTIAQSSSGGYQINVSTAMHWVTIRGFVITGGGGLVLSASTRGTHHDILFEYNEIKDAPNAMGLQVSGSADIQFLHNKVHDIGSTCGPPPFGLGYCHGIYPSNSDRVETAYNEFYNISGYGIHYYDDTSLKYPHYGDIHHNLIHDNYAAGIIVYGNSHRITNNISYDNGTNGILCRYTENTIIYNNTTVGNATEGISLEGGCHDANVVNNLLWDNGGAGPNNIGNLSSGSQFDHNLCTVSNSPANAGGRVTCSQTADPDFIDEVARDLRVNPGSVAIDNGLGSLGVTDDFIGTARPQGSGVDIGAYEQFDDQVINDPAPTIVATDAFTNASTACLHVYDAVHYAHIYDAGTGNCVKVDAATDKAFGFDNAVSFHPWLEVRTDASSYSANQSSTVEIVDAVPVTPTLVNQTTVGVRFSTATGGARTGYYATIYGDGSSRCAAVVELLAGVANQLTGTDCSTTWTAGARFGIRAIGNEICMTKNGNSTSGGCATNTDIATGAPALGGAGNTSTLVATYDNAEFGTFDTPTPPGIIVVTGPIAGVVAARPSAVVNVTWDTQGLTGNVNITYAIDATANRYPITTAAYNANLYAWTVDAPAGTAVKMCVSQGVTEACSGAFTVRGQYFK